MATSPGSFVWYELMTSDPAAAESFYATVVGWNTTRLRHAWANIHNSAGRGDNGGRPHGHT